MKKKLLNGSLLLIIHSFFFLILLSGCAHTWSPGQAPEIGLDTIDRFQGNLSVQLINNQPETKPKLFAGIGGHTHYANYNEWTQFFIDTLSKELTKRGVRVSNNSTNKIKVKLSNFAFFQGFAKVRVNMTVLLESGDGKWSKQYEETDASGFSLGRAFGSIVYHTIEKILKEPEILDKMKE